MFHDEKRFKEALNGQESGGGTDSDYVYALDSLVA